MSTINISPEIFWKQFSTKLFKIWSNFSDEEKEIYSNYSKWTKFMTDFLYKLGEDFGFNAIMSEYWPRVDVGYFINSDENTVEEIGTNWSKWSFEVAIEHENNVWPAWKDECNKLMVINAGLKILITYRDESKNYLNDKLSEFRDIYKSRKYHQINDQWLFIIGPNMNIWKEEDFVAYMFDGENITDITNDNKIFSF